MPWTTLCELDELTEGRAKPVDVAGFKLAVFLDRHVPTAIDELCPHANRSLAGGWVEAGCAVCPAHGWTFKLDTGEMPELPGVSTGRYATRVLDFHGRRLVQADLPAV